MQRMRLMGCMHVELSDQAGSRMLKSRELKLDAVELVQVLGPLLSGDQQLEVQPIELAGAFHCPFSVGYSSYETVAQCR